MTLEEFSNEFDVLMSSYSSLETYALAQGRREYDEYEKSVFLTKALEQIVTNLYNGGLTKVPFEGSEELRRYLSDLVKTELLSRAEGKGISRSSTFFSLPEDLLFITFESVELNDSRLKCGGSTTAEVVPVTLDEYHKTKDNPFRGPNSRRVLRLDIDSNTIEIISKYEIEKYLIRYLSKPSPIILDDLPDGLKINNISIKTECKLNPAIHRTILDLAVQLALHSRQMETTAGNKS